MSELDVTPLNYQQLAMRSLSPPEQYKPPPMDLFHALCGIMTESGELMDQLKQYCFYGKEYDRVNLKEEAGDLLWYVALLCQHLDCSLMDVMQMNINKLRTRYPEKFTTDGATIRDLRAERDTLEQRNRKTKKLGLQAETALGGGEKQMILEALRLSGGNKTQAAKELGISRRTVYRKVKLYALEDLVAGHKRPMRRRMQDWGTSATKIGVWATYYETSVGDHNAYRTMIAFTSTTAITWFRLDTTIATCMDCGLTLDKIEPYIGADSEARDVNGRRPRVWDLDELEAGSVKLILPISG